MSFAIEQDARGLFGLCIFNAENTTDDEIHEVFGKFGSVVSMNRNNKLVFVRYGSLIEAEQCCQEMQSHPSFKVKPAKRLAKGNPKDSERNYPSSDNFNQRTSASGFSRRSDEDTIRRNDSDLHGRNGGGSMHREPVRAKPMPKLCIVPPAVEVLESDAPEAAKEVVIGNIPPKMKQADVYMMCSRAHASPLHVAMKQINRPNYKTVYYSFVYVKTDKDVKNIIEGLNNLVFNGYKMIVASADSLYEDVRDLV